MKPFWRSKTFWVNAIALGVLLSEEVTGRHVVIGPEVQAVILAGINLVLRKLTSQAIDWR